MSKLTYDIDDELMTAWNNAIPRGSRTALLEALMRSGIRAMRIAPGIVFLLQKGEGLLQTRFIAKGKENPDAET